MVDEIKSLIGQQSPNCPTENFPEPITPEELMYYGLEYKYVTLYAIGEMTYEEMFEKLNIAIRQFAKRQMTWFRGMERRGIKLNWIDASQPLEQQVSMVIETWEKQN